MHSGFWEDLSFVLEDHLEKEGKINDIYEYVEFINRGNNNSVYKIKEKKSNLIFAAKEFNCELTENRAAFLREASNLVRLNHENVISLRSIVNGQKPQNLYIIMDYCPLSLADVIDSKPPLNPETIKSLLFMLLRGLSYLHNKEIIHRDINPTNLMLSSTGILKIIDFGLAIPEGEESMNPSVGTRWYRAPELLFACDFYTSSVDIWSAGCIFGELLLHKPLFPGNSDIEQISLICQLLGTPNDISMPGFSTCPLMKDFDLVEQPHDTFNITFKSLNPKALQLLKELLLYDSTKRVCALNALHFSYFKDEPVFSDAASLLEEEEKRNNSL